MERRVYISVNVSFNPDGQMLPRSFKWSDGNSYRIDRIAQIKPAYTTKAGGIGERYSIYVNGKQSYLYFEPSGELEGNRVGRWYVKTA